MQVFLRLETLSEKRSVYTAIINLCCRNKINLIYRTKFSNKTPQIPVYLDYTILQQVCTVNTVHGKIVIFKKIKNKLRTIVQKLKNEARAKFTGSYVKQKRVLKEYSA